MSQLGDKLDRIADALERLGDDPVIQMETGPPVCPHCERMNPNVDVEESGGSGPLSEFVIRATCLHCNNVFYCLIMQWQTVAEISQIQPLMDQLKELSGYGNNGNSEHPAED